MLIDLRSDTFTKPTPEMLETMMKADVGDDVFGEDPTVNSLESLGASMFGMEAALFCPSGTMTNQIAIKCHTQPGNEVICEKSSHVYIYEGGGIAFNSSCQVKPIDGNRGRITATQVVDSINSNDIHKPVSALVSLENTSNRGGGSCYEISELQSIKEVCLNNNIRLHLDGARIWNALVARQQNPLQYGEIFDSISICLSKGLGAPVGSLLLGNHEFIYKARRVRKVFGGGMRQAGYLAAAGLFAMENNISRLETDHLHAKMIGEALSKKDFVSNMLPIETNMIIFEVSGKFDAKSFSAYLKERNVFCIPISSSQVRMVTHLDITSEMVNHLTALITTIQ
ncbi:MAG: low-specificity L-threonine aldolase [Bacteroidota bacterium]